ncbi:MAG TPA: glycosyltransferase family 39 protein [Nitrospiraceae bacterium]|nr:glycosyltransferase family 39 protein [Nitrospiraceae bacterium]
MNSSVPPLSNHQAVTTIEAGSVRPLQLILLLALAGILFFLGLGSMGLTDRDEGRNAEAGREMYEQGQWISPTFNYEPRFAKPVFVYWLMSLSYHLFGVTELAARLPSAIAGMSLIFLQYVFLTRCRGSAVGLFGAAMLLLNVEIVGLGRMALTDSVLNVFVTLALFGFWLGYHGDGASRHWLWLFYIGMALATLTKGPIGVLIPLITVAGYLSLVRDWRRFWARGYPLAGMALCLLLATPWYVAMLMIHGDHYTTSAQTDTVGRFLGAMEGHGGTPLFYIPILIVGFFPWSGWLPFAWYRAFTSWRAARKQNPADPHGNSSRSLFTHGTPLDDRLDWFAAVWLTAGLVFFSLSSTRLPHYIAPLFPAAAILTASFWHRSVVDDELPGVRAAIHTMTGLGYLLALGFAAVPALYDRLAGQITSEFPAAAQVHVGNGPYMIALALLLGMAMVSYFGLSHRRRPAAFWAAGASFAMMALLATQFILPIVNYYFIEPPQRLAEVAGLNLTPQDRLVIYGQPRPSLVFYARRKAILVPLNEEQNITQYLTQSGRTMILLPQALRSKLPAETAEYPVVLQHNGYILLSDRSMVRTPPPTPPEDAPRPRIPGH